MKKKSVVEIFCDGNPIIGFGHIRRSIALANFLTKQNISVKLSGLSEEATKYLPQSDYVTGKAKICIFDSMIGIHSRIAEAKKKGKITVTLDWFGDAIPDINIVVYAHSEVRSLMKSYIGYEYIILREEILKLQTNSIVERYNNVLVCLGGGDLLNQGHLVSDFLNERDFNVTLVQGPFANNKSESDKYKVLINPWNLPDLIQSSDWIVTNGGGTLFESLYIGKAVFVLPQTELERTIADDLFTKDVLLGVGMDSLYTLNFSTKSLKYMVENGPELVDGKGLERIGNVISNLF